MNLYFSLLWFVVACTRLYNLWYKSLCRPVPRSVRQSVMLLTFLPKSYLRPRKKKRVTFRKSLENGSKILFCLWNLSKSFCGVLVMFYHSLHAVWHWLVWNYYVLLKGTSHLQLSITRKYNNSCFWSYLLNKKSQIVEKSFAIPNLM